MSETWSLEEYKNHCNNAFTKIAKKPKYGNKKVVYDEIKFDSTKEKDRYIDLKYLHNAKKIIFLGHQVSFILPGDIKYVADFVYFDYESLNFIVEDVKSEATRKNRTYINKKKQLKALYNITILET